MSTDVAELRNIAERYRIRDLYVFGSRGAEVAARLRGEEADALPSRSEEPLSDLDVGVQPERGIELGPRDRVRISMDLEDLFEVPRVDLVVLSEAKPFLALEVVKGELLLTADPTAQAEHELYVLRRAADLAPFQRERVRLILTAGAR